MATPETWEVALSTGEDKKQAWERLLSEGKLGALAFLRHLRNIESAGVADAIVRSAFQSIQSEYLLSMSAPTNTALIIAVFGRQKLPVGRNIFSNLSPQWKGKIELIQQRDRGRNWRAQFLPRVRCY